MFALLLSIAVLLLVFLYTYFNYPTSVKDLLMVLVSLFLFILSLQLYNSISNDKCLIHSRIILKDKIEKDKLINIYNIQVNTPFILINSVYTKIRRKTITLARNNKISYKIEFINSDSNIFSEPINIKSTEITKIEKTENSVIYYCNMLATKNFLISNIEFMGTPTKQGQQKIKITFDDKKYSIYNREQTLIFENSSQKHD